MKEGMDKIQSLSERSDKSMSSQLCKETIVDPVGTNILTLIDPT